VIDIDPSLSQHLLEFTIADAIFAVSAYCPEDDVSLKMSAFKWVHVLLLQLNSGINLPSPDLCNSAVISAINVLLSILLPCYVQSINNNPAKQFLQGYRGY